MVDSLLEECFVHRTSATLPADKVTLTLTLTLTLALTLTLTLTLTLA